MSVAEITCTRCGAPECDAGMDECTDCSVLLCHACAEDEKHLGVCPDCEAKARGRMVSGRDVAMSIAKRFGSEARTKARQTSALKDWDDKEVERELAPWPKEK